MFRKTAWGLDLGRSAVKGVLVAASDDGISILKADIVPLEGPPPDPSQDPIRDGRLWRALGEFRRRHLLRKDPVCLAIPAQNTFVRDLTVAPVSSRKTEDMVRYEAANEIPFVLDEVAWDYLLFDRKPGEPTQRGLLLAVKRNVIETYVNVCSQLGVGRIERITLSPLALADLLHLELDSPGRTLVLDIGAENTNMLLMADGRFWMRSMLAGGNRVTSLLQDEFELEFGEAERAKRNIALSKLRGQIIGAARPAVHELVRNMKANLSHLEHTGAPAGLDAVLVVGGGAHLAGVREALGTALRQPVRGIEGLKHVAVSPEADARFIGANLDQLAVAIGAALSGAGKGSTSVSFLPKAGKVAQISRSRGALLGVGLVLWAAMLTLYFLGRQAQASVQGPLAQYRQLFTTVKRNQQDLKQATDRAREERDLQQLLALSRGRTQPAQILGDVVAAFTDAGLASRHAFLLSDYQCRDVEMADVVAKATKTAGTESRRSDAADAAQPESAADASGAAKANLLVGDVRGVIRPARGATPGEAYASFTKDLLPGLRNRASLRKASARATFTRGSMTVVLENGPWSQVVATGDLIRPLPAGNWYRVASVASETGLSLAEPFKGDDGPVDCAFTQVSPGEFNPQTLEFSIRFAVPRAAASDLSQMLGGPGT